MAGFGDHFDNRITELQIELEKTRQEVRHARAEASGAFWLGAIAFLFVMLLLLVSPWKARAADPWSHQDRALEAAWVVCHLADWGTTADLSRRYDEGFYETNFVLGKHPSTDEVHLYMAAWVLIHPLVTNYLPPRARPIWQYVTIGVSGGAAVSNLGLGLNMKF